MKLSVIIPMYNEEKIVEEAVAALDQQLLADFGAGEYEMIFVSDGSRDTCKEKAEAMRTEKREKRIRKPVATKKTTVLQRPWRALNFSPFKSPVPAFRWYSLLMAKSTASINAAKASNA